MSDGRGDREAFGPIFDRDVAAVFAGACDVVGDPTVAAEIAIETFAAAWDGGEDEGLVDAARERGRTWLATNRRRGDTTEASGFDPVWRARIVAGLEVQGIPTRPPRRSRPRPARKLAPPVAGTVRRLAGGTRRRVVVGVAAGAVAVVGLTALGGGPGAVEVGDEGDGSARASATVGAWPDRQMLGPGAPTTVTTLALTTTTAAAVATTRPSTEPAQPSPAPTVRPSTTVAPAPAPPPVFRSASAYFRAQDVGLCSKPNESLLTIQWQVDNATQVWIYRDAEPWEVVSTGAGTARYCSPSTREYHLVARDAQGREARATVTAPALP